jgi:hypothetical protein
MLRKAYRPAEPATSAWTWLRVAGISPPLGAEYIEDRSLYFSIAAHELVICCLGVYIGQDFMTQDEKESSASGLLIKKGRALQQLKNSW